MPKRAPGEPGIKFHEVPPGARQRTKSQEQVLRDNTRRMSGELGQKLQISTKAPDEVGSYPGVPEWLRPVGKDAVKL